MFGFEIKKQLNRTARSRTVAFAFLVFWMIGNTGCDTGATFTRETQRQTFLQSYLPQYLDIVWMIDDRSPMYNARTHLISEAKEFFTKLDGITVDYRMAFVSADMEIRPGLKPSNNPIILSKNFGTVNQRADFFGNIISQIINLQTGARNQGFESVLSVLKSSYQPRPGVPLIILFISDADDKSPKTLNEYRNQFLTLKGNNPELLRVYSVNYVSGGDRCATLYNADIDKPNFEDRYFQLANSLSGETGDLCGNFSDQIDVTGLRLEELKDRFTLNFPNNTDMVVKFFMNGVEVSGPPYTFETATSELVFASTPPEGMTIEVTYVPRT